MDQITLQARGKVNLIIDVVGKREDGYHDLRSVMQTVTLSDKIVVKKVCKENYLKVVTNLAYLPADCRNVVFKTARLLIERYGIEDGVFLSVEKRIPVAAGLGGGSADCAAALVGMKQLFGLDMSNEEMMEIGLELGADVPFCLQRGIALAEGIGERLTKLKPLPKAWFLLAKPPFSVSTAEIFGAYDTRTKRPDVERMLFYIDKGDLRGICGQMANVLETVTIAKHPLIGQIKELMLEQGALGAIMSGSGPTVFGIYEERARAHSAQTALKTTFPHVRDVFVVRAFNAT